MKTILINIKELIQIRPKGLKKVSGLEMKELPLIKNAFLIIENERIADYGAMEDCPPYSKEDKVIRLENQIVMPAWCDSHTHLVYAGNRINEFVDRINGLSYEEIFQRGGGILNSAKKLNETDEVEIYEDSKKRLLEVIHMGTGAIEIKSGYGLTVEGELKMLRIIQRLKAEFPIPIKATFLGAHAFPAAFKENHQGYIDLICHEMIPKIAQEKLADFIDVFLETGYFSVEETEKIIKKGKENGLIPKIHVNQFTAIDGIRSCVKQGALSVDHLEIVTDEDIKALQNSDTMPVALPSCSFFISIPYTPARKILEAGLPLALATDYNPGTSPSGNMNFVVATACIKMKMTPEEAINGATINGAYAMGLEQETGSITIGKLANLILTKPLHSYRQIPYEFGNNHIDKVILKGQIFK
jgi:imidazolonepropionase